MAANYSYGYFFLHTYIMDAYKTYFTSLLRDYNLQSTEIDIITFLVNNAPHYDTATDISRFRGVSKGLVSKHVNQLIDTGLLISTPNENDNRFLRLSMANSHQAREIVTLIEEHNQLFASQLQCEISAEHFSVYETVSKQMYDNMKNLDAD